jgi:uncharacterized surface protein with fasciclin (FAS1) repeats
MSATMMTTAPAFAAPRTIAAARRASASAVCVTRRSASFAPAVRSTRRAGSAAAQGRGALVVAAADTAKSNTIVDAAIADPQFSVLVEAVVKANLAGALKGPGPFTVLAPTNEAFIKALGALKLSKAQLLDLPNLGAILKFHVISGAVMSSALTDGLEATTLEGSKVKFSLGGGAVKVNGANVIKADIKLDNGVIHVIDTVILPPVKPKEYLAGMAGISLPFGGGPFDPLGFTEGQTVAEIKRLRESELIHGRVCMLAAVGILVGEKFNPLFDGSITGLAIDHWQQVPAGFEGVVTLAIGIAEAGRANKGWVEPGNGLFQLREGYAPGDLGFDPLGLLPTAAPVAKEMATKELNNGRLAMLATAGMVMQELVTGKTIAEQMNW